MGRLRWVVLLGAVACSSTGRLRTTMRTNHSIGGRDTMLVRVTSDFPAYDEVVKLESQTAAAMRQVCGYGRVLVASATPEGPADVVFDMRIVRLVDVDSQKRSKWGAFAGAAKIGVKIQVTDVWTRKMLGAAYAYGESGSVAVSEGGTTDDAIARVVEKSIEYARNQGCALRRERVVTEADVDEVVEEEQVAAPASGPSVTANTAATVTIGPESDAAIKAETANDEGKSLYKQEKFADAAARFRTASSFRADARYSFNLCLALEALKEYDAALAACGQVYALTPSDSLEAKTEARIKLILQARDSSRASR